MRKRASAKSESSDEEEEYDPKKKMRRSKSRRAKQKSVEFEDSDEGPWEEPTRKASKRLEEKIVKKQGRRGSIEQDFVGGGSEKIVLKSAMKGQKSIAAKSPHNKSNLNKKSSVTYSSVSSQELIQEVSPNKKIHMQRAPSPGRGSNSGSTEERTSVVKQMKFGQKKRQPGKRPEGSDSSNSFEQRKPGGHRKSSLETPEQKVYIPGKPDKRKAAKSSVYNDLPEKTPVNGSKHKIYRLPGNGKAIRGPKITGLCSSGNSVESLDPERVMQSEP